MTRQDPPAPPRTDLKYVAFDVADRQRAGELTRDAALAELARRCPGLSAADYERAFNRGWSKAGSRGGMTGRSASRRAVSERDGTASPMSTPDFAVMQAVLVGAPDPEIVALEARIRAAQLAADVVALGSLIADELLFTGPDGQLGTKAQDLEAHGSGAVRFRAHEPEELRVRRIGTDVAVSALRAALAVEVGGALVRGTYRYTRVWAREGGGPWRVVGGHVSEVPPPGPAAGERRR